MILYGQSLGGDAAVQLAWRLADMHVPVLLTIQLDSVGAHDHRIPPNVMEAVNFYQSDGFWIKGESSITAVDPTRTRILGNFRSSYEADRIDLSDLAWYRKIVMVPHTKMDRDPEVLAMARELILSAIRRALPPEE